MDARTFEELVRRHQGIVCGVAYAVLRDRARSEEVAQEAFLIAWQKQIDAPAWICAVARNLARNSARRRREEPMESEPISVTEDARDALIAHEDAQRANAAIAQLPAALREAIVVYYHGDESMAAVAAALDISHAAAKQRVHRGREQLREQLVPVESHLRRARPGAAFTGACIAAWLSRGRAEAATPTAAAAASTVTLASIAVWVVPIVFAGVLVATGTIATPREGEVARVLAFAEAPLERLSPVPPPPGRAVSASNAAATSTEPETLGPNTPFSMRSNGGTLIALTAFLQSTINVPIRVADGFDAPVSLDVDDVPALQVLDSLVAQAHSKRTEITAVRIVQQGGRTDAATLGGDPVTLHIYDKPMFEVIPLLEPSLHMPIFRDVVAGQLPGPSSIDGEWYVRNVETNELELVPHVTIDLVNVTAGEALAQILEQTGLGYVRATGYLIEPLADE